MVNKDSGSLAKLKKLLVSLQKSEYQSALKVHSDSLKQIRAIVAENSISPEHVAMFLNSRQLKEKSVRVTRKTKNSIQITPEAKSAPT